MGQLRYWCNMRTRATPPWLDAYKESFLSAVWSVDIMSLWWTQLTPARTLSISGLKSWVLKLSFLSLKMIVKSGLYFILKFTEPLQK